MLLIDAALRRSWPPCHSAAPKKVETVNGGTVTLQREVADGEDKLKRLYALVDEG